MLSSSSMLSSRFKLRDERFVSLNSNEETDGSFSSPRILFFRFKSKEVKFKSGSYTEENESNEISCSYGSLI